MEAMKPGPNRWTLTRPGGVSSVTGHIWWSVFVWRRGVATCMVTVWLCPHCGRKFYSANESREEQYVTCANCEGQVVNPHCQGESEDMEK